MSLLREEIETKSRFISFRRILHADKDRNGSIDVEELRVLIRDARNPTTYRKLRGCTDRVVRFGRKRRITFEGSFELSRVGEGFLHS